MRQRHFSILYISILLVAVVVLGGCNKDDDDVDYTTYYAWRDRNNAFIERLATAQSTAGSDTYFAGSVQSEAEPYAPPSFYHVARAADENDLKARHRWFTPFYTSTLRVHYTLYDTKSVLDKLERVSLDDIDAVNDVFFGPTDKADTLQSYQVQFFDNFTCASVVVGWGDILQQMHEGDSWVVAIPWFLGYGQAGSSSGGIDPYSTLFFRLELVDIVWWGGTVDENNPAE